MRDQPAAPPFQASITVDDDRAIAFQRFRDALATGNPRLVRSAAADLPDVGVAEAAAIMLVIERTEPENYDRTALSWLAQLATEARDVGLKDIAEAAIALAVLPRQPSARTVLAEVCTNVGLPDAASVFAPASRSGVHPRER
jgi:hypothetical protein